MRRQKCLRPCVDRESNFFLIQRVKSDQESRVTPKTKETDCGILPYAREVMNKYFDHVWSPLPIFDLESGVFYIQYHSEKSQRAVKPGGSISKRGVENQATHGT